MTGVENPGKIVQERKSSISTFDCFVTAIARVTEDWALSPPKFFQYILLSKVLSRLARQLV